MKKIPQLNNLGDVKDVILEESGEEMVILTNEESDNLLVFSKAYKDAKKGAIKEVLVRKTVKDLLIKVSASLPKGYKLVAWETYTPLSLHEGIRERELTKEEIKAISHMTGGAVDVTLSDSEGNLLEMGTELNHGSPEDKATLLYENLEEKGKELSEKEKEIQKNRRILFHAMNEAGFSNNPLAWFHWDYGNLWWAKAKEKNAFYGSIVVNIKEKVESSI